MLMNHTDDTLNEGTVTWKAEIESIPVIMPMDLVFSLMQTTIKSNSKSSKNF